MKQGYIVAAEVAVRCGVRGYLPLFMVTYTGHVTQGYIVAAEVAVRWGITGLRVAVQSVSSPVTVTYRYLYSWLIKGCASRCSR